MPNFPNNCPQGQIACAVGTKELTRILCVASIDECNRQGGSTTNSPAASAAGTGGSCNWYDVPCQVSQAIYDFEKSTGLLSVIQKISSGSFWKFTGLILAGTLLIILGVVIFIKDEIKAVPLGSSLALS